MLGERQECTGCKKKIADRSVQQEQQGQSVVRVCWGQQGICEIVQGGMGLSGETHTGQQTEVELDSVLQSVLCNLVCLGKRHYTALQ